MVGVSTGSRLAATTPAPKSCRPCRLNLGIFSSRRISRAPSSEPPWRRCSSNAASLGYRVAVIEEGTFDRIAISHAASLLDIWMKYGAVLPIAEVEEYLNGRSTTQRREDEPAADGPNER